jgi:outer membrane protein assembly factor BamD
MKIRNPSWLIASFLALAVLSGCSGKKAATSSIDGNSAEADKLLYERAENDIKHNRYEVARLTLQTLINTYPDSEYLAKGKLAIADSYSKEGGTAGLTQAVAEYQDFITFFPFLDEAAYAQMQIGLAHYRRMEKADRDRSEALEAEGAFQSYLQKYPHTELYPMAEQRLREVQEVVAEGDYRIATFYYTRRADRAAASRLLDLVSRYPLFSEADHANWMLASIYERTKNNDAAAQFYAQIVKQYPTSSLAADAKSKLVKLGAPVPQADPTALARMQQEQQIPRQRSGILSIPAGVLKSGPNVSMAARVGTPTMTPQAESVGDTLTPTTNLGIVASGAAGGSSSGAAVTPAATAAPSGTGAIAASIVAQGSSAPATDAASGSGAEATGGAATDSNGAQASSTGQAAQPQASSSDTSSQTTPTDSSSKKKKSKKKAPQQ